MRTSHDPPRYVVLPTRGLRSTTPTSSAGLAHFLVGLNEARSLATAKTFIASAGLKVKNAFKVIDSIHEDGAKLVEMSADVAKALQASEPGLRIVPVVYYKTAVMFHEVESKVKAAATALKTTVTVTAGTSGKPVKGATVVAFTDFQNRQGAQGATNAQGVAKLTLGNHAKIERLFVYPEKDFWGALRKNLKPGAVNIALTPVDLGDTDALRHYYGASNDSAGAGVKVAVIDTGVGPHPDLKVDGGLNCVSGVPGDADPNDFGDNGEGHGSHVGGIIAARGTPPTGLRGLAPAVTLRSYRVFGKGAEGASNYDIAKAIDAAWQDKCDIINLSLGGGASDPATQSAIHDARENGCVVVAAAGNDYRGSVSFPGADPLCIAVSALGRKGTFPKGTIDDGDVMAPHGHDASEFIASFSNIGPEIDLTGAGVGILSTVPGGYAPMSGTSMASPAVAGFAARLLAGLPAVLAMAHNQSRSDAIAKAILQAAKDRGFPATMQGNGLPLP